jgi:hypothetical protein
VLLGRVLAVLLGIEGQLLRSVVVTLTVIETEPILKPSVSSASRLGTAISRMIVQTTILTGLLDETVVALLVETIVALLAETVVALLVETVVTLLVGTSVALLVETIVALLVETIVALLVGTIVALLVETIVALLVSSEFAAQASFMVTSTIVAGAFEPAGVGIVVVTTISAGSTKFSFAF